MSMNFYHVVLFCNSFEVPHRIEFYLDHKRVFMESNESSRSGFERKTMILFELSSNQASVAHSNSTQIVIDAVVVE